jgi:hypothetical protein
LKNVEYPGVLEIPPHIMSEELQQRVFGLGGRGRSESGLGDGDGLGHGCTFQLQAVVLHHGKRATGGHYSAYTRDACDTSSQQGQPRPPAQPLWRSMNDSKVNVITEGQALAALDSVRHTHSTHKYSRIHIHIYTYTHTYIHSLTSIPLFSIHLGIYPFLRKDMTSVALLAHLHWQVGDS